MPRRNAFSSTCSQKAACCKVEVNSCDSNRRIKHFIITIHSLVYMKRRSGIIVLWHSFTNFGDNHEQSYFDCILLLHEIINGRKYKHIYHTIIANPQVNHLTSGLIHMVYIIKNEKA